MGTSNDDIWGGGRKAAKRPVPRKRPRPQPPARKPRGVCPRCGASGAIDEPCRQVSCQGAIFAKATRPKQKNVSDDTEKTVMVAAYRERKGTAPPTDDSEKTVMVAAYREHKRPPTDDSDKTVMVSAMKEPSDSESTVMMPVMNQQCGEEKTVFIAAVAPSAPKADAPRPKQARRPRPQSRRPRPQEPERTEQEPERTVLVSISDVPKIAIEKKGVATRKAPEHRRPAVARKLKPIDSGYRAPTNMRPAFDVDPADLERASSQKTLTPEAFDGALAATASSAQPVATGDMEIVSATSARTDWVEGAHPWTDPSEVAKHPEQRRRPVWLVPLLAAVGTAALVGTFLLVLSGGPTPGTPVVIMTPGPPIVVEGGAVSPAVPENDEPTVAAVPPNETLGQESDLAAVEPKPEPTPAWVQTNASLNPWVKVAGAPAGTALGLSAEQLARSRGRLTGFHPESGFSAPTYGYSMQSREVTWEELGRFIFANQLIAPDAPSWSPSDGLVRAKMPATSVPWELANSYCQALGGALPSEAEWAWAARGAELRTHPWGEDLPYADRVRLRRGEPVALAPVATMSQDVTPGTEPLHEMLGNAAEWTRDVWVPSESTEDIGSIEVEDHRAVRGWPLGDPGDPLPAEGLTYRRAECAGGDCLTTANLELIGFRCMRR